MSEERELNLEAYLARLDALVEGLDRLLALDTLLAKGQAFTILMGRLGTLVAAYGSYVREDRVELVQTDLARFDAEGLHPIEQAIMMRTKARVLQSILRHERTLLPLDLRASM